MSRSTVPPRFVPTLTEVVLPTPAPVAPAQAMAATPTRPCADLQDQMVQRILQRVDLILERRLREVVGQLILEHTQTLAPRLRDEIEQVVRQSVSQAFEQEEARIPGRS